MNPTISMIHRLMDRISIKTSDRIEGPMMQVPEFQKLRDNVQAIREDIRIMDELLTDLQPVVFGQSAAEKKASAWLGECHPEWVLDLGQSIACECVDVEVIEIAA